MIFQKESNGHKLTIEVNTDNLLQTINLLKSNYDYINKRTEIVGDTSEDCSIDKDAILQDLDEFAKTVSYYSEHGDEIFDKMTYKKNGAFSVKNKPILKQAVNGEYWDDYYGWNTMALRVEPVADAHAKLILKDIIVHY